MFKSMMKTVERFKRLSGAPKELGNISVNHFKRSFAMQRFNENGSTPWQEVQRRTPGTKAYKYGTTASRSNPILRGKGSGTLAKSLTFRTGFLTATVYVAGKASAYGSVHNNGIGRMAKRHFMGSSKTLSAKHREYIRGLLKK